MTEPIEFFYGVSLLAFILVLVLRLLVDRRSIVYLALASASILMLVLAVLNMEYIYGLFYKRYGLSFLAFTPPLIVVVGERTIVGIIPGLLILDHAGIVSFYILLELISMRRLFRRRQHSQIN